VQPDPSLFLPAIRREILRADLFGANLTTGLSPILMMRAGEALVQLQLRYQHLPAIARALQSRLRRLIEQADKAIATQKLARPPAVAESLALAVPSGAANEDDRLFFDAHVRAAVAALAALGVQGAPLGREASAIELSLRQQSKSALAALRADLDAQLRDLPAPRHAPTSDELTSVLKAKFPGEPAIAVRELRPLPGINSQEIYFFELQGLKDWTGAMVLRRASEYNPTQQSLANEFDLLKSLKVQGIPVPRVLAADADAAVLGGSFIVMERLAGAPQTAASLGAAGRPLMLEIAAILARIHQVDTARLGPAHGSGSRDLAALIHAQIDRFYDRWQRERLEPSMTLEAAFNWLRAHIGDLDGRISLVHGDCNLRNILVDAGKVSAILDWELTHPGHAAEDLSYIRPDVEAIMPWADFIAAYEAAGEQPASAAALRYFDVWREVWRTAMAASISGAFQRGETHNFIFGTVALNEYYATLDVLAGLMAAY
jgi:aminoglycoside phosphotransferase (APT) family kinase protein